MALPARAYDGPGDLIHSYRGRLLTNVSKEELIAIISMQERAILGARDRELQHSLSRIGGGARGTEFGPRPMPTDAEFKAARQASKPTVVFDATYLTGVVSLPVQEMRLDPVTHTLSFVETYPGKTYATQLEADCDYPRKRAEMMARVNDRMIEANMLAGAYEPKLLWWRFWR